MRRNNNNNNKKNHHSFLHDINLTPKKAKKKIINFPHTKCSWLFSYFSFSTNVPRSDFSHQQCQKKKRFHKCSPQSLCPRWPLLVHADEGGESQDQVPAGQRDVCAPWAPIGCSVGRCGQETRQALISCDCAFILPHPLFSKSAAGLVWGSQMRRRGWQLQQRRHWLELVWKENGTKSQDGGSVEPKGTNTTTCSVNCYERPL